ncbi:MAG: DUF5666 domain-containing protein [Acidobacteriia bacterium]|nr:DUF5666 domain-containing protein [Terriglobia bacterium]
MNNRRTTITRRTIFQTGCFFLVSTLAFAHGGLEHVMGTVTAISDTSVTVKTAAGKAVEVGFDAKTTFSKNDQAIQKAAVKVGDRVVIHAEKSGSKLLAHTVEIGTAGAAKAAKH